MAAPKILKNGELVDDPFTDVSHCDEIPTKGAIIVSLQQWQAHPDQLAARPEPLGIFLRSEEKPEQIKDDLAHFAVVALEFPTFRDGRAYSYARLLRERYNYEGELRAVGDVLLEQLHFMARCGINAFEIDSRDPVRDWLIAAADISVWYQPTADGRPTAIQLRHNPEEQLRKSGAR